MRQLAQLAGAAEELAEANAEVVVVFRENEDGAEGLAKADKVAKGNFTLLNDPGAKATPNYSTEGFSTYIIDGEGKVQAQLSGSLKERPVSEVILEELDK